MSKKTALCYIGAGVLFAVSAILSKRFLLTIGGVALIVLGFVNIKKDKESDQTSKETESEKK